MNNVRTYVFGLRFKDLFDMIKREEHVMSTKDGNGTGYYNNLTTRKVPSPSRFTDEYGRRGIILPLPKHFSKDGKVHNIVLFERYPDYGAPIAYNVGERHEIRHRRGLVHLADNEMWNVFKHYILMCQKKPHLYKMDMTIDEVEIGYPDKDGIRENMKYAARALFEKDSVYTRMVFRLRQIFPRLFHFGDNVANWLAS